MSKIANIELVGTPNDDAQRTASYRASTEAE
jgi:hypothetical protein